MFADVGEGTINLRYVTLGTEDSVGSLLPGDHQH
jgi:hypothetical protein